MATPSLLKVLACISSLSRLSSVANCDPSSSTCSESSDATSLLQVKHQVDLLSETQQKKQRHAAAETLAIRRDWLAKVAQHKDSDVHRRLEQRANSSASTVSGSCTTDGRSWCDDTASNLKLLGLKAKVAKAEVVVSTYMEDLSWLRDLDWLKVYVYVHNRATGSSHAVTSSAPNDAARSEEELKTRNGDRAYPITFVDIPNIGDEAKAYLTYIMDNYDRLPDVVFFVHGHRCSWHAKINMDSTIQEMTRCISHGAFNQSYVSLNTWLATECYDLSTKDHKNQRVSHVQTYWSSLISTPLPRRFCMDCCAQFAVSRDAIRSHPQAFYKNLLDAVDDGKTSLEYFWRSIFRQDFQTENSDEHEEGADKNRDGMNFLKRWARYVDIWSKAMPKSGRKTWKNSA
mmetsp:Transcript_65162/g.113840  ORF Transcript_65162/g.113840 Transcript_65162/m.113840 type:complete len:401 (-) Transcript_65162:7-1209(-)